MASIIRWISRLASRLCCGSECIRKNDSEEILVETKCKDDTWDETFTEFEFPAPRDITADDDISITEANELAAVNKNGMADSPQEKIELLFQGDIQHSSKYWSTERISEWTPNHPDVFVCIEGKEYLVHSQVLTPMSTFMRHKLEGREGLQSVIFLPSECLSSASLESLLEFAYYGDISHLDCCQIEEVKKAARYLGMEDAKELLMQMNSGTSQLMRELNIMTESLNAVVAGEEFLHLDKEPAMEVLKRYIGAGREMLVFAAALKWLHYDRDSREAVATDVMDCVRFSEMSEDEVSACRHSVLMQKKEMQNVLQRVAPSTENNRKDEMCKKLTPRTMLGKTRAIKLWN